MMSAAVFDEERDVEIRGIKYKMILQNGEPVLRRFDEGHKMWVTLKFTNEGDSKVLDEVAKQVSNLFTR